MLSNRTQKAVTICDQHISITSQTVSQSNRHVPVPIPKAGEVLVHILLRPVNPADIRSIRGQYGGFTPLSDFAAVPGLDAVGEIVTSSGTFGPGQHVVATGWPIENGNGTWQEYYAVSEELLVAVPDGLPNEQAAIFWGNPVTAVGLLRVLAIPKGEWLLQSAAGSAIGRQIIQIACSRGIRTINLVRQSSQQQELYDLGADVVIATDAEHLGTVVCSVTQGKGAFAAVDCVGGELTGEMLSSVKEGGTLLVYGSLSGATFTGQIHDLMFGQKLLRGFRMGPWFRSHSHSDRAQIVQEVWGLLEQVITPYVGATYPLDQVKAALMESTKPSKRGKIFLSN